MTITAAYKPLQNPPVIGPASMASTCMQKNMSDNKPPTLSTPSKCIEMNLIYYNVLKLNPLSPKSDQYQISPCNVNAL